MRWRVDEAFFTIMKERNPELFSAMVEEANRMQRDFNDDTAAQVQMQQQEAQQEAQLDNSFMRVEEQG